MQPATSEQIDAGSSPLTRGKHAARDLGADRRGLIPAHAGKTSRGRSPARTHTAHPRSRGENRRRARVSRGSPGSSPLTRGKRWSRGWPARPARLIPAHAGKTDRSRQSMLVRAAHPRSRGENQGPDLSEVGGTGSSPLTRGKQLRGWRSSSPHGLIPAHAGKTLPGFGG